MVPDPSNGGDDDDAWNGDTDGWDTFDGGAGGGDERSGDLGDREPDRDNRNPNHDGREPGSNNHDTTHDDFDTGSADGPNSFVWHVSRVADRFGELIVFALIPLLTTLLDTQNVRRALSRNSGDFSITLEFVLPSTLLDLWSFADPPEPADPQFPDGGHGASTIEPAGGATGGDPGAGSIDRTTSSGTDLTVESHLEIVTAPIEALGLSLVSVLVFSVLAYAAVFAVLEAVYVGGIDRRLETRRIRPIECIRRYAPRLFAYTLLVIGATLLLVPVLLVAPLLFLLALPAAFVLSYLFYAVPFLFVVDDAAFLEAFERSLEYALEGGAYFWFAVKHVVIAVGASIALSIVVSVGGPIGFVLAVALTIPLALVLTAATTSFLRELVELENRETPDWAVS